MSKHLKGLVWNFSNLKPFAINKAVGFMSSHLEKQSVFMSDEDTYGNSYDVAHNESIRSIWDRVYGLHTPRVMFGAVTVNALNTGLRISQNESVIASSFQKYCNMGVRVDSIYFNSSQDPYGDWLDCLDKNNDINLKLQRELKKRQDLFDISLHQKIKEDLNKIVQFINNQIVYSMLGLELTKRGSFIFTIIIQSELSLYLVYNALEEDEDGKLYYRIFHNNKDIEHQLGSVDTIISAVKANDLIEILPQKYEISSFELGVIPEGMSLIEPYYDKHLQYIENVPDQTLIPNTI